MTDQLPSPDVLEEIVHRALKDGDAKGVHAALLLMAGQDPHRAESILDTIKVGLHLRSLG